MKFPSSNTDGANPAHGDIVSNVGSSHGVRLSGGSTGGIVEPVGDDANITLTLRGKGTGKVRVSSLAFGSSGTPIVEARAFTVQFTAPPLSSGLTSAAESTFTVAGVSTGAVLVFTPTNAISPLYNVRARCSTTDELVLCFSQNGISTLGTGESTNRGTLLQFRF